MEHTGEHTEVDEMAAELCRLGRLKREHEFIQHGSTTVYQHSLRVARVACKFAAALSLTVDRDALIRGALLHDYSLYDWHEADPSHRLHGFRHPSRALQNAREDFELTATEEDIIAHHMFPLVPIPPHTREGWIVMLADKVCALEETIRRS